jgi:uncharacterized membrane protein YeaQ/YmgE (transglycosylase-associated protein family)
MEIVWILVAGIVAGWLAGVITRGSGFGILGDLVVGVVGSAIGGIVFPILGIGASSSLGRFLMAIGGAVLLLTVIRLAAGKGGKRAPSHA